MKTPLKIQLSVMLMMLCKACAQNRCLDNCRCLDSGNECYVRTLKDLHQLRNVSVYKLSIEMSEKQSSSARWIGYGFLANVKVLVVNEKQGSTLLTKLLPLMDSLNELTVRESKKGTFPDAAYKGTNLVIVNVKQKQGKSRCTYRKIPTKENCTDICGNGYYSDRIVANRTLCVCVMCTPSVNLNHNSNSTNSTKTIFVEQEQHKDTIMFSLILAGFSLLALLTNFFVLSKICSCHGLTVIKIFGMSLMIFNVLLAEYGIAIAAYLSQEDHHWDKLFCSGLSSLKLFAINATVFTLTLMIFHKSINPVDGTLEKRQVRFKAIVYILEGLMFSGMAAVISWIKFNDWDYLCSIWYPRTTVEKLLYGIEATPHIALVLLWTKHLYRGAKKFKHTGHCEDLIELELSTEREHPIFFIVLITSIIWSVPYIMTLSSVGLFGIRTSAVIRTCAYLFGAALHPFLFVIRHSWLCGLCCESQIVSAEDELLVCECKGMQLCKSCEQDMTRILARCEDRYIFEDRRKSMSLDNLSLSLPRKKVLIAHPNVKECKGVSHSFPLLNSTIFEESGLEGPDGATLRQSFSFLLRKFLQDKLPDSLISNGTPRKSKMSTCSKLRESYSSLPLLNTGSPKSTPQKKPSHRVTFRSAHNTPVKKLPNFNESVALEYEKENLIMDSCLNYNTETEGLLEDFRRKEMLDKSKFDETDFHITLEDCKSPNLTNGSKEHNNIDALGKNGSNCRKYSDQSLSDDQSVSTPDKSDPNRHSRIPTFIPFNSEPGPSGYFADKDSDNQTPTPVASPPPCPAKNEKSKKRKLNGGRKIFKKKSSNKDKGEDKARVSRGPTFFPFTIEEDTALDTTKGKKNKEEKTKKKKSKKEKHNDISSDKNQRNRTEQRTVSMDSLEWDPSFSLSDSSSSPVDELVSPVPPMKPSPFALKTIEQSRQSSSSYGSAGRGSSYSMEWDPTAVQPRVMTPQCEWEPYAVEEPGSSSGSNGVTSTLNSTRSEIETANVAAV